MAENKSTTIDRTAIFVAGIGLLGALAAAVISKVHIPGIPDDSSKGSTPHMPLTVPESTFAAHNLYPIVLGSLKRGMPYSAVKLLYGAHFAGDEQKATATLPSGPFSQASFEFRDSRSGPVLETITLAYRGNPKDQEAVVNRDAVDRLGTSFDEDPLDSNTHIWKEGREKLLVAPDKCVIESSKN